MAGRKQTDYFRIGVFVIVGIVLVIIAILAFSSSSLFSSELYVETYFNESVQGLSVGSKVKYRGIDIGTVKKIKLVSGIYDIPEAQQNLPQARYVYVLLSLDPGFMPDLSVSQLNDYLKQDVAEGLRIKMSMQGLTGGNYLELNFSDPEKNPPLPLLWKPHHLYIPSETSTLTQLGDSVQKILAGLQDVNFNQLFANLQALVNKSDQLITRTNNLLGRTQNDISVTLSNMRQITTNLRENPSALIFSRPQPINPSDL